MQVDLDELVSLIPSGCSIAIASDFNGFYAGAAMAVTRELIRRRVRDIRLIAVPTSGLQADMLIGAGCIVEIECGAVIHGEYGAPPRFLRAFGNGSLRVKESSCPAIFHGLTAAGKGAPFMPVRGLLGSDLLALRPDWKVIDNPMDDRERVVVVPAIHPDIGLFHAPMADRHGNVYIGRRREMVLIAHASRKSLVTVERLYDGDLTRHPELSAGTLSNVYVDAFAVCKNGSWPFSGGDDYPEDSSNIAEYLRMARSDDGFGDYLERYVLQTSGVPA